MKIGISIAPLLQAKEVFPDIQELIELLVSSEIGIKNFEIHTNPDLIQLEILKLFKVSGAKFSIHLPHIYSKPPINFCSTKPSDIKFAREALETSIEIAKELKAKNIIIHPDISKACTKQQAQEILRQHLKYGLNLINKDQFLLIENMPGKQYTFYSPAPMKKFIDSFNSKQIGACWDVGHAKIAIGNKFLEFPKILKKQIKEVHILDVKKGKKSYEKYTDHHTLGSGILNFNKIIKELKKIKFNNLIIMEIIPKEASGIEISKKILEKAIREA